MLIHEGGRIAIGVQIVLSQWKIFGTCWSYLSINPHMPKKPTSLVCEISASDHDIEVLFCVITGYASEVLYDLQHNGF